MRLRLSGERSIAGEEAVEQVICKKSICADTPSPGTLGHKTACGKSAGAAMLLNVNGLRRPLLRKKIADNRPALAVLRRNIRPNKDLRGELALKSRPAAQRLL